MLPTPTLTGFIRSSVSTEDHLTSIILEHSELVNNGENEDIDMHSTDPVQKDSDISKTGLGTVSDAVKIETHLDTNINTRDPICELKFARVQTVLPAEVTSEFMKDPGQGIMIKPVKDNSLTPMASKAQNINPKDANDDKLTNSSGGQVECNICHKCFRKPSQLKIHVMIHKGENVYKCQVCKN